ncbi:SET domain-containing protein [bacterium]|nr:SET domain-containing protein [bacterium]PJA74871.1 MAG: hypothetical protein CO151_07970 [bacterium CG_4_9_14_3_um_filter_65_15]
MGWDVVVRACELGRGLFAARPFATGELILKFTGPHYERGDPIHQTDTGANLLQTGWRSYILLDPPGVFANHSCRPNAGVVHNRLLAAIEPIAPGQEICFDYSTTMAENFWTMPCRCGSPACRGVVTDFRLLPAEVRDRYLRLGIVQGFIAGHARVGLRANLAQDGSCDTVPGRHEGG